MRKQFFFLLLFHCVVLLSTAQTTKYIGSEPITRTQMDSAHQQLVREKTDTGKVEIMLLLARGSYHLGYADSQILYARQALAMAQKIKDTTRAMEASSFVVRGYSRTGDHAKALQEALSNLKLAEQTRDMLAIYDALRVVGLSYSAMKDYKMALAYARRLKALTRSGYFKDEKQLPVMSITYMNLMGIAFDQLNVPDSAWYYKQLAYMTAVLTKNDQHLALTTKNLGDYFFKGHYYDSAFHYYQLSIPHAQLSRFRFDIAAGAQLGIAKIYQLRKRNDSALFYAKKAFATFESLKVAPDIAQAASLLHTLYAVQTSIDSAYKYLVLSTRLNDSLNTQEKVKQIEALKYGEALRLQQMEQEKREAKQRYDNLLRTLFLISGLMLVLGIAFFLYRNNRQKQKANTLLLQKNAEIDKQRNKAEQALDELKATQAQLVQREKMASLGEVTAGIAHEIQNPLNFINNFSELNRELVVELKQEADKRNIAEVIAIAQNIEENEQKINHHGKRADAIVKGMLQHSRGSTGKKEPTNINELADEYLRLSYHGLRAKDNSFKSNVITHFDKSINEINVTPQDIGRVLLNLFNNAFYAVNEKKKQLNGAFEPEVSVTTKKVGNAVHVLIRDNGTGIPQNVLNKIFQPFFTTKPTGEGTGLGLYLSYDIITKGHGGELNVETKEGEYTTFVIRLPAQKRAEA